MDAGQFNINLEADISVVTVRKLYGTRVRQQASLNSSVQLKAMEPDPHPVQHIHYGDCRVQTPSRPTSPNNEPHIDPKLKPRRLTNVIHQSSVPTSNDTTSNSLERPVNVHASLFHYVVHIVQYNLNFGFHRDYCSVTRIDHRRQTIQKLLPHFVSKRLIRFNDFNHQRRCIFAFCHPHL